MKILRSNTSLSWMIGGCSVLLVIACISLLLFSVSGVQLARQWIAGMQAHSAQLPSEMSPAAAVLQNVQGWVEVQSEVGEWSQTAADQLVTQGQHIRTGKLSSVTLLFMDGSRATLQAESEVVVEALDAPEKGQRTIVLTQVAGESHHKVIPNPLQASRYEVLTGSGSGVAKGTEFDVVVTPAQEAYFFVTEGVVAVSALETTVLVNPGFMTVLVLNQPPLEPLQTVQVEGLLSLVGSQWTVAGTTFATDDGTIVIGNPQVGDWVLVKGHQNENGQNVADWVILKQNAVTNRFRLSGTVEAMDAGQWKVNGQTLLVDGMTVIDGEIQVGDTVYVSGMVETGGLLRALEIERLDAESGQSFAFTGILQAIESSQLVISGVPITVDEVTAMPGEIVVGDLVVVRGRIQSDGTWLAKEVTLAEESENEFKFSGTLESKSPWKVAGISFELSENAQVDADLTVGDLVRVEGTINTDGIWIADSVERIEDELVSRMVLIGTVIAVDPWVVNGITLTLAPDAAIADGITAGMLVRVELVMMPDGSWQAVRIDALDTMVWFPGCIDVIATVVAVNGNQLQLLNWPAVVLADGVTVEGTLAPNSVIRMRVCFDEAMVMRVTYIIIVESGEIEPPASDSGGKVTICHKPGGKKGGNTLSVGAPAVPAHLGHGDYIGACR